MSLRNLFQLGRRLLKGKKESATPATGQQQKQITYEPKPSQAQGQELAKQEFRNPPVVLKKTKPLQMGDDVAPAFGSSTYDWAMRIGRGKYTADEWLNHLTSQRKVNFKVFGKPATKNVRSEKRFTYDSGQFAGKEVNISKEELFDTNLALFNEAGDLTGGLLYAAKKFGLKLDANEVGAMIKLNPLNRLKAFEFGASQAAKDNLKKSVTDLTNYAKALRVRFRQDSDLVQTLDDATYQAKAIMDGDLSRGAFRELTLALKRAKARPDFTQVHAKALNQLEAKVQSARAPLIQNQTKYGNETSYTLQGGKDYKETVFYLDEAVKSNKQPFLDPGHFGDTGLKNQVYHVRFDTRFTPDGKKVFMINEIQSDLQQGVRKALSKTEQLAGEKRINPFQADIEINLLARNRAKLSDEINDAILKRQPNKAQALMKEAREIQRKMDNVFTGGKGGTQDYLPMVESDVYGDHALKYLMQKAAREGVDYVAVAPFTKLAFRQGYKKGNERFYGYATGKGIDNKGKAVMPELMKKSARFYNSKAGPTKISLSDPQLPYKNVQTDKFKYPGTKGKEITSDYHLDAMDEITAKGATARTTFIPAGDPRLYFDAFAIKVTPLMRSTQKTYKSQGGLVVDMFKPIRYN